MNDGDQYQHLLKPTKYTSRDKSMRLNHGGFDGNTRDEKVDFTFQLFLAENKSDQSI